VGQVEFVARYKIHGRAYRLHEKQRLRKTKWVLAVHTRHAAIDSIMEVLKRVQHDVLLGRAGKICDFRPIVP